MLVHIILCKGTQSAWAWAQLPGQVQSKLRAVCLELCTCGVDTSCMARRDAICALILGSPPGKVYSKLRSVCSRLNSSY